MTNLFDYDDNTVATTKPESQLEKAKRAFQDLNNRTHAETTIHRAGRNASSDDLRSIANAILEEAKSREAK